MCVAGGTFPVRVFLHNEYNGWMEGYLMEPLFISTLHFGRNLDIFMGYIPETGDYPY